ncbi:hypothetical protein HUA74_40850 [Myxococcus sp. CA051A]|uniref:Uncharacterized protein n=1 Tax=Myxococcus llanfairpwllgwyngyllgogerychwyrndrobwllllantysiliogogogochensis TaxID=2590453 RepID=A0A540WJE3_9BACT|nr:MULTISPECIES: hypothetical protein [Myxococcus]NTX16791.1 hypothetical protein [Myxococcus sp. CA056]NTX67020.1 hypothetical protein [Myxococcus sp. CA051A]TQF09121.1 hypothetical protein FJV41_46290 [Myxococcus llanfairpwllgwyngyllgogerychwyrndrobwllllantysiliogogogochensis]
MLLRRGHDVPARLKLRYDNLGDLVEQLNSTTTPAMRSTSSARTRGCLNPRDYQEGVVDSL